MDNYFSKYVSNTSAATGNQSYFSCSESSVGRAFYKVNKYGKYEYSFLFSNVVDSTFADGSYSKANTICNKWQIEKMNVYIRKNATDLDFSESAKAVTFSGKTSKTVMDGETFYTDGIELEVLENEYICIEIYFKGDMIPNHPESIIPVYRKSNAKWIASKEMPLLSMLGVKRDVKYRIGFIGDSITQGIGTNEDSYAHWNALLKDMLGNDYAYWNLGLGYGRAEDMATLNAWFLKAVRNDIVFVCYGVNDILQGKSADEIIFNIDKIIKKLTEKGVKVILQTVPPFDYNSEQLEKWLKVNEYILNLKNITVFDNVPYLMGDTSGSAKFGGHPNEDGCKVWAENLYKMLRENENVF